MQFKGTRILITGASSGIGRATAFAAARRGARLVLVGRDQERLTEACREAQRSGAEAHTVVLDLTESGAVDALVERAETLVGGVDVLVNSAGVSGFSPFESVSPERIEKTFLVNTVVPIQLTQRVLPAMRDRGSGRIVNVGSIFGSIGFPYFATYSASKFALRGFSEALRRELDGTGVDVTYVAPRATRTPMAAETDRMADAVGMKVDDAPWVATQIVGAIEKNAKDRYLGFPEKLFARVNGVLPRLVDGALRKQARQMRPFAEECAAGRNGGTR